MELLKMMNQIISHEKDLVEPKIGERIFSMLSKKINSVAIKQTDKKSKSVKINKSELTSGRFIWVQDGDKIMVMVNQQKKLLKLHGISNPNKDSDNAKEVKRLLTESLSKKQVYFKLLDEEYIVYKQPDDNQSINEYLISQNLSGINPVVATPLENKVKEEDKIESSTSVEVPKVITKVANTKDGMECTLLKFGRDKYLFKEDGGLSYYVTVSNAQENSETYWGVDLERAIKESNSEKGDIIFLKNIGKQLVTIKVPVKDNGKIVREEEKSVERNSWDIKIIKKDPHLVNETPAIEEKPVSEVINTTIPVESTAEIKEAPIRLKNCYALKIDNNNLFSCMVDSTNKTYELNLNDYSLNSLTPEILQEVKTFINSKISTRVVYFSTEVNQKINIFANKNSELSINSEIIDFIKTRKNTNSQEKVASVSAVIDTNTPIIETTPAFIPEPTNDIFDNDIFGLKTEDIVDNQVMVEEPVNKILIGGKPVDLSAPPRKLAFGKKDTGSTNKPR